MTDRQYSSAAPQRGNKGKLFLFTTVFAGLLLLFWCSRENRAPEFVYVPGPGFEHKVTVMAVTPPDEQGYYTTGQWLELKAERRSGPWIKVKYRERNNYPCWWVNHHPPPLEKEVQGNVRWEVIPPDRTGFEFNLPGTGGDSLQTRKLRFYKPGAYTLQAVSKLCPPTARSNILRLVIKQG